MKTKIKLNGITKNENGSVKAKNESGKSESGSGKNKNGSVNSLNGFGKSLSGFGNPLNGSVKTNNGFGKADNESVLAIILMALSPTNDDYIPGSDSDFDEWQKNFTTVLSATWDIGGATPVLRVYLGIPDADWFPLLATKDIWTVKFAKLVKEANRTNSDITAKQVARKVFEKSLREFVSGFIRGNKKATADIKRALNLTVPDTEPSPRHSTEAPVVAFKPLGGGMVDVHCRRTADQSRPSMIRNYRVEIRYVLGVDLPANPDDISSATTVTNSKAHFKINAGIVNSGKKLRAYARWIHEHDSDFDSPWAEVMPVTLA